MALHGLGPGTGRTHTTSAYTRSQNPGAPPLTAWPPCLKISGVAPDLPAPINRQVEQHDLPFILALNCRPYFTCRSAMNMHVQQLAAYCERTWATKVGLNRIHKLRPHTHRPRRTAQEVEEHRLQRAL